MELEISDEKITQIKSTLPELPDAKKERYINEYNLKHDDAEIISSNTSLSVFFEKSIADQNSQYQLNANFILSEIIGLCNKKNVDISDAPIKPEHVSKLIKYNNWMFL